MKFEVGNAHLMLTKGADKIKIKINKHKEDECSAWCGGTWSIPILFHIFKFKVKFYSIILIN